MYGGPREAWAPHPAQYGRGPMEVSCSNVTLFFNLTYFCKSKQLIHFPV